MVARRVSWLFIVAVLAVAGCGGGGGTSTADADRPADTPTGQPLEFTATTVDGKPFDGRSLVGRPAVLWFWAPWCPVCLQQAPGVESITNLSDEAGEVWKRFGITAQSTFVLIDTTGTITFHGRLDADEVPDRVAELLG